MTLSSSARCLPFFLAALGLLSLVSSVFAQIPAFPGAEGAGAYAKGGRGGDVYHVTNTNPSGAGSLAYGLTTGVPAAGRTIVFDVSGYAHISGTLRVTASKITIAGQTAPGDGFGLKDGTFLVSGDDFVVRHLRYRDGNSADAIDLDSGSLNSMFDHVDAMFSNDENMSSFGSPPENLTFQWSLNAWGMESHSCGGLWDQNHATSHHTLWAHNHTRNPKARPLLLDWVNNVTFDWDIGFIMGDSASKANWNANIRGCYFVSGTPKTAAVEKGSTVNFSLYLDDSVLDGNVNGLLDVSRSGYSIVSGAYNTLSAPLVNTGVPVTIDDHLTAYKKIVSNAGPLRLDYDPNKPLRDEVAALLISELVAQTHHHISSVANLTSSGISNGGFGTLNSTAAPTDTDRDGMPDFWENALVSLGWNAGTDDHNTVLASSSGVITAGTSFFPTGTPAGYTRLEEYLHFLAIPHAVMGKSISGAPAVITIDLRKFTSGFTKSPTFAISGNAGGTYAQFAADGVTPSTVGPIVKYTAPTAPGRAMFDFTVLDTDGSQWKQTFAILISNAGVPRDLAWKGDGTNNNWDTATNNWLNKSAATSFSAGDTALFDDTGSASPNINLTAAFAPGSVTVDSTQNYTFSGAGSLTGAMALTKNGPGTLALSTTAASTFIGGVTINEGVVSFTGASTIGGGPITLAGGQLTLPSSGTVGSGNPLAVVAASAISAPAGSNFLNGAISGTGALTLYGNSTLTIAGAMTAYAGALSAPTNAMTLRFNNGGGAPNSAVDLGTSATLNNRSGGAAAMAFGALTGGPGTALRGSDQAGAGVIDTYTIGSLNQDMVFAGAVGNGTNATPHLLALTKTGTGRLTLNGTSAYTGATTVSGGTLAVNGALGATATTVGSGAALLVNGSIGNASMTVSTGATLGGTGAVGGAVTAQSGSTLAPGNGAAASIGKLTVGAGLALQGATVPLSLSSSPNGANDQIQLTGGALALSGTNNLLLTLTDGFLGAGTYNLIAGGASTTGSIANLSYSLPTNTRQTYALSLPAGGVQITVGGAVPASLSWTGANGGVWDLKNTSSWSGGPTATFFNLDAVAFNDSASNGSVNVTGSVQPRSMTFTNNAVPYTLGGTGSIGGQGALTKTGSASLTITPAWYVLSSTAGLGSASVTVASTTGLAPGMTAEGVGIPANTVIAAIVDATHLTLSQNATAAINSANLSYFAQHTYTGGTTIGAGSTILLGNDIANRFGLGVGPVTLDGGTLTMFSEGLGTHAGILPNSLIVNTAGTLNAAPRCGFSGNVSGAGTLTYYTPYVRADITGDWSVFTGQVNVTTDADGGDFRISVGYAWPGIPHGGVNLADNAAFYFNGTLASGAGTTIEIGEMSGNALSTLMGGSTGGRNFTYRIGGKNTNATFAGTIKEQNASTATSYVKTGSGVWTLSGPCNYNGGTTVEAGTLSIAGTLTCGGSKFEVLGNATLNLASGTLNTAEVTISGAGTLTGKGTINGDLSNQGTLTCGAGGTVTITGEVINDGTIRLTGGTALNATGSFVNNGVLDLLTGSGSLPPNLVNNGVVVDSSGVKTLSVSKTGNIFTLTVPSYTGHNYQLQRAVSLAAPITWTPVDAVQAGTTKADNTPTVLTFTDSAAPGGNAFYRVQVSP